MSAPVTTNTKIKTAWLLDWYMSDSDHWAVTSAPFAITYNSLNYIASPLPTSVGRLADTAKASDTTLSVSFSGVDINFKYQALQADIVGRPFNCYRVYFNDDYSVNTISQRYAGLITSVTFDEDYPTDLTNRGETTFSVLFQLRSIKEILKNRVAGRFTTSADQQRFFPGDTSMDQIPAETGRQIILGKT